MLLVDNQLFFNNLATIHDIDSLISKKETIKNQIMDKMSWENRMLLYKQVQLINQRISELKSHSSAS